MGQQKRQLQRRLGRSRLPPGQPRSTYLSIRGSQLRVFKMHRVGCIHTGVLLQKLGATVHVKREDTINERRQKIQKTKKKKIENTENKKRRQKGSFSKGDRRYRNLKNNH